MDQSEKNKPPSNKSRDGFIHIPEFGIAQQIIDKMTGQNKISFLSILNELDIKNWGGIDLVILLNEIEYRLKLETIGMKAIKGKKDKNLL